ncbi:MAG: hypothetical protein F6K41_12165 [Symploca sp. SIO3E6]|nr:hypothetical protein [Caldora sp. SIO3E6]
MAVLYYFRAPDDAGCRVSGRYGKEETVNSSSLGASCLGALFLQSN